MVNGINEKLLQKLQNAYSADAVNTVRGNAARKLGINEAAESRDEMNLNPHTFSIEIKNGEITHQKQSGRCWMFAGLNVLRFQAMKKLNMTTFELSQNYLTFWDKLEKANYFLEAILKTLDEPVGSRLLNHLLFSPVQDGGQWDMFSALVEKYGVIPKVVMPETFHSSETMGLNRILTKKLHEFAYELRTAAASGMSADALQAKKEEQLVDIYRVLGITLGEPPKVFMFECRDKDNNFIREENVTPMGFYKKYVGDILDEYVSVINAPTADKPYLRTFTVEHLGNVVEGRSVKYINLPSEELRRLTIAQLSDDEPVWFGCDVGQGSVRKSGLMSMEALDYEALLGVNFTLDKGQRLDYADSMMTHAMVFLGVNLVDGKPNRWKVENSWGDEPGQKGYFVMADSWFDEYNYQVVINKKYLSDEQKKAWEQEPIVLLPWDPMGSLAMN